MLSMIGESRWGTGRTFCPVLPDILSCAVTLYNISGMSPLRAKVVFTSVETQWISPVVLSEVPFPGTRPFGALIQDLQPFQPDATRISVETPSNRISDVAVRFGLRNGDIQLSLFYTGFRVGAAPFENSYQQDLGDISKIALARLGTQDLLSPGGRFVLGYQSHLRLEEVSASDFLRGLLGRPAGLDPDGCSYRFTPQDSTGVNMARVLCECSVKVNGGLYVQCNLEFEAVPELDRLTGRALEAVGYAIELLGIKF